MTETETRRRKRIAESRRRATRSRMEHLRKGKENEMPKDELPKAEVEMTMAELRDLASSLLDEPRREIARLKKMVDKLLRRVGDLENARSVESVDGEERSEE